MPRRKAIVIEDKQTYLMKMQEQIDEGDYKLESRKEKIAQEIDKSIEKYEY